MALQPLFIMGWKQLSAYQAYGTCNGVLSLGRIYGYDRLESAAALMKALTKIRFLAAILTTASTIMTACFTHCNTSLIYIQTYVGVKDLIKGDFRHRPDTCELLTQFCRHHIIL